MGRQLVPGDNDASIVSLNSGLREAEFTMRFDSEVVGEYLARKTDGFMVKHQNSGLLGGEILMEVETQKDVKLFLEQVAEWETGTNVAPNTIFTFDGGERCRLFRYALLFERPEWQ